MRCDETEGVKFLQSNVKIKYMRISADETFVRFRQCFLKVLFFLLMVVLSLNFKFQIEFIKYLLRNEIGLVF